MSNFEFLLAFCVAFRSQREVSGMCLFVNKLDGSECNVKSGAFTWTSRWCFVVALGGVAVGGGSGLPEVSLWC